MNWIKVTDVSQVQVGDRVRYWDSDSDPDLLHGFNDEIRIIVKIDSNGIVKVSSNDPEFIATKNLFSWFNVEKLIK